MKMWQKTVTGSKAGFDKLYGWVDKLGPPVNRLSNKLGSEAFWPTTLDKESDKAARILRSFCKDGFYQEELKSSGDGPKQKQKVLKKIPAEVIRNAKGLVIFTTMRTGLWISGAGGSGIIVGRTADGSWSPPSGIMLHTAGLGFLVGVDIYDCVIVINTQQALEAFSRIRCTVGGEISAVAGPVGVGGVLETEVHKRQAPLFTYLKSRGFYAGVQIDGTIMIERTDENERFYNERISAHDILAGKVRHSPYEIRSLMETIKAAQGDADVNESLLTSEPAPADFEIEESGHIFGIPDQEDPDPFGVLALEKEGLEIREAGTHQRASLEAFEFKPSPTSPIYNTFSNRRSMDSRSVSRRSSWRTSTMSNMTSTTDRGVQTVDMGVQTDFDSPTIHVPKSGSPNGLPTPMENIPENDSTEDIPPRTSTSHENDITTHNAVVTDDTPKPRRIPPPLPPRSSPQGHAPSTNGILDESHDDTGHDDTGHDDTGHDTDHDSDHDSDHDFEDPVPEIISEPATVHSIAMRKTATPQAISRARLVTVVKPAPPKLPPRSERRRPVAINAETASGTQTSPIMSPMTPGSLSTRLSDESGHVRRGSELSNGSTAAEEGRDEDDDEDLKRLSANLARMGAKETEEVQNSLELSNGEEAKKDDEASKEISEAAKEQEEAGSMHTSEADFHSMPETPEAVEHRDEHAPGAFPI